MKPSPGVVVRQSGRRAEPWCDTRRQRIKGVPASQLFSHEWLPEEVREVLRHQVVCAPMSADLRDNLRALRSPQEGIESDYVMKLKCPVTKKPLTFPVLLKQDGWELNLELSSRGTLHGSNPPKQGAKGGRYWFEGARTKAWIPAIKAMEIMYNEHVHSCIPDSTPPKNWLAGLLYSEPGSIIQAPHCDHLMGNAEPDAAYAHDEKFVSSDIPPESRWQALTSFEGDANTFLIYARTKETSAGGGVLYEIELDMSAGCVVFFSGDLVHAGAPNTSEVGLQRHFFYIHGKSPGDLVDHNVYSFTLEDLKWQTRETLDSLESTLYGREALAGGCRLTDEEFPNRGLPRVAAAQGKA